MKSKTVYWIIGILVVLALGYWIYTKYYKTPSSTSGAGVVQRKLSIPVTPIDNKTICVGGIVYVATTKSSDGTYGGWTDTNKTCSNAI